MSTEPAQHDLSTPAGPPVGVDVRPARRLLVEIAVAVLLVMLVRIFVMESFHVPSASMAPTIVAGDRVVVTKIGASHVERGDVIVFDGTATFAAADRTPFVSDGLIGRVLSGAASALSIDLGEQDFLKRVAGVGGDRVACTPARGLVVNGASVDEPWLAPGSRACDDPFDVVVPQGRLFVLGDNRSDSADSRAHLGDPGGGMVPVDDVVGHVSWRYWPLDRIGGLGS